jgi:uncharacterized membrane protein YqiK
MSEFFASLPTWLLLLGFVVVAALVVFVLFRSVWRVAEPNEALILSGLSRRNNATAEGLDFKIVTGTGTVVIPGLQTVRALKLSLYETALDVTCVTTQGIPVIVRGVVIFKIGDTQPFIANAARRFLGQQDQMTGQVYNVFEGHLRSIIGSLTVEEMIRERDKLASKVREASGTEMEKLGLVVDSLQIKDFEDPTGYITNLAKPHIAEVQKAARIAEAMNNREASEREAEAAAQIAAAQSESQIRQSRARAEAERVHAEAAQAGPLADATARQQVVVQETEIAKLEASRQEQRLNATVYKQADADAYAKRVQAEATKAADISAAEAGARKVELAAQAEATAAESRAKATRTTGEAEAAATTARGVATASATKALAVAEADGIEARAHALSANQDAVIAQQLAERMPEIVRAAAEPFAHVGQMTVLNGAEGLNGMVAGIIAQVGTLLPQLTSALGRRDDQPAGAPASQPATNSGPASLPPPSVTPPQDVANAPAAQR